MPKSIRQLVAVDLFAGAGGLSEGLRQAGYSVKCAVELDPLAIEAYRLNHPSTTLLAKDIRAVSGGMILRALGVQKGEVDLVAACPPCQGFSTLRTRNGSTRNRDSRNALLLEVLRLVRATKPKAVMLENVPALGESLHFARFRKGLRRAGYKITWDILNVRDYGVPQSRRRLVMLGALTHAPSFAVPAKMKRTVRSAIGGLHRPRASRDPLHNYESALSEGVLKRIRKIPRNGGSRSALPFELQLACHRREAGFRDVYGRMAWDAPSPTITGGCINPSKGRFLHPSQNRAITLREAAILQSFPRSYRFPLSRGRYPAALLIGNALPPEFVRRQATALRTTIISPASAQRD